MRCTKASMAARSSFPHASTLSTMTSLRPPNMGVVASRSITSAASVSLAWTRSPLKFLPPFGSTPESSFFQASSIRKAEPPHEKIYRIDFAGIERFEEIFGMHQKLLRNLSWMRVDISWARKSSAACLFSKPVIGSGCSGLSFTW